MLLSEKRGDKILKINKMIDWGYISVAMATIFWVHSKLKKTGLIGNCLHKSAKPSIITVAALNQDIDLHMESWGRATNNATISDILIELKEKTVVENLLSWLIS